MSRLSISAPVLGIQRHYGKLLITFFEHFLTVDQTPVADGLPALQGQSPVAAVYDRRGLAGNDGLGSRRFKFDGREAVTPRGDPKSRQPIVVRAARVPV